MNPLISNIDRLKDVAISRRDRELLYIGMALATLAIAACFVAAVALTYYGRDPKSVVSIADSLIWVDFGLVVVFVAGTVENRRVTAKTMAPAAVAPIVVQAAEPSELVENVAEIAADVDKMANKKGKKK